MTHDLTELQFAPIPSRIYELGLRFLDRPPAREQEVLSAIEDLRERFSPYRSVTLPEFEIATTVVPLCDLLGDPYELELATIEDLCDLLDKVLRPGGLRIATEDELEAAAGGSLFPWGQEVPDGIPYGAQTSFVRHRQPNAFGLTLNNNPYKVEVCRTVLKFGDGGCAICGAEPWPIAWLTLSPSYRLTTDDIAEFFPETLEEAYVRPVKL